MKKFLKLVLICTFACLLLPGCAKAGFEKIDVDVDALQEMIEEKESFILLVERDNCPFCSALNDYIDQTKEEHAGIVVYVLDISEMNLEKPTEDAKTLVSPTESGEAFLKICPYFYYTPTMYRFTDGVPVQAGVGYNTATYEVSLWGVDSTADLDTAETENVWTFIEGNS